MHIIIGIIIAIVVISIVYNLLKAILPYVLGLIAVVGAIALLVFIYRRFGIGAVIGIVVVIAGIVLLVKVIYPKIREWIETTNHQKLVDHLYAHCQKYGCMDEEKWKKRLPQFASKSYDTSFNQITRDFTDECEKKYIPRDHKWIIPEDEKSIVVLENAFLTKYPALDYTHSTSDETLIRDAADKWNSRLLTDHLNAGCQKCGRMDNDTWSRALPEFAENIYESTFNRITYEFADECERKYIFSDHGWVAPAVEELIKKNTLVPLSDIINLRCPVLEYTHVTPDDRLISSAFTESLRAPGCKYEKKFSGNNGMDHYGFKEEYSFLAAKPIKVIEMSLDDL